jgi:predicted metal-dependent HD superfamily phosphohydrolase
MAILGSSRRRYQLYAAQVRQEYIHVSPGEYCIKRANFLQGTVNDNNKHIYASDMFLLSHESQARANMTWECNELRRGCIAPYRTV